MRKSIVSLALLAIVGASGTKGFAAETSSPDGSSVDSTRSVLAKWVETQKLIAKERGDWQQNKETLNARIELVKGEIAALSEKRKELDTTTADASGKVAALRKENEVALVAVSSLEDHAGALEGRIRQVWPSLPDPLQQKLRPLHDRMPADPANTKVSVAERFQNVVGILNEINKFNGDITRTKEVRTLSDGKPSEVETVYVGLGQAYFLSAKGEAGIGHPTPTGWSWDLDNDRASSIARVFDVLGGKSKPAFVSLPVRIQ